MLHRPIAAPPTKRARGFTLIELLVALAAMALVAIMSWRGLDGMIRTQESTRTQGEQQAVLQTVLAQWSADLNALMPLQGRQVLDWDGQVLRMTRKSSGPVDQGAWVVAWSRRNVDGQFQWVRWQSLPARTVSEWNDAWMQAAQWGRNPSSDQMRRETVLLPLELWRVYYYRNNAWSNPQSSDGSKTDAQSSDLPLTPDGIRIELTLPPGRAMNGVLTLDWVNPLRSNNRS
ncbi:prepilin-type N-terminal cleavage/methylation domain-containing protein [Comamonas resistens]|uniref:Prepilin-type N-terminal cleavage/methylation domain-containing protein n=1 Tax=Comamonas resistens TaxID=3046670 RepID=A0ABY8T0V7_9BURK|nr:prepilin-type N-terminal cleavage/methylation domain-containing protein [Comamonas resistens]MDL5036111.1 prepilin-type N-terminal cleavage/methylation domain-containing protein [Comamonas resistens]WHS67849.1 prepilin-type N-terminal cleavage/methylation domain-containing protein [Comamonas resistens]